MPNLAPRLRHALALLPLVAAAAHAQTLGGLTNVYSGAGFSIPDQVTRTSSILVSGFQPTQTIRTNAQGQSVVARLNNLTHTWVGDLWARLTFTPTVGASVTATLFFRPGVNLGGSAFGSSNDLNGSYSFGEFAPGTGFDTDFADRARFGPAVIAGGNFYATNSSAGDYESMGALFGGLNPNGTWTLTMRDEVGGDSGNLGSWDLAFATTAVVPEPSTYVLMATGLGVLAGVAHRRRRA